MGEKNKIAILFGAGAEQKFELCNGADFAKIVIGKDTEEMNEAIRDYYKNIYNKLEKAKSNWYSMPKCFTFSEINLLKASIKKAFLEGVIERDYSKEFDIDIKNKVENEYTFKDDSQKVNKYGWDMIDNYTSYMGLIDEKFHTIISPKFLGPNNFWKVVFCYTRAYLVLVSKMYYPKQENFTKKDYITILENPKKVLNKMNEFCSKDANKNMKSYYSTIRNRESLKDNIRIITTNYTPLCSKLAEISDDRIAYVHGRIGWFESPYELQVYDLINGEKLPEYDICFPYIFIQSGVKPVVEEKQVNEYHKMIEFLNDSRKLMIIGYKLNCDDNHITSFIKSFINKGGEVVYFSYRENTNLESVKSSICTKLRTDEKNEKVRVIKIDDDNDCCKKFEEELTK